MTTHLGTLRAPTERSELRRPEPASELVDFAKRQIVHAKLRDACECRKETREMVVVPVFVQPIGDDLEPVAACLEAVTRDLTSQGAGLVYFSPITFSKLALQIHLGDEVVNLISRVAWRAPLGPFYGTGVSFLERVAEFPGQCEPTSSRLHEVRRVPVASSASFSQRAQQSTTDSVQLEAGRATGSLRMDRHTP